jgi:transposase InsO family protein
MVGPAAKREAVAHLRNVLQMSERRACTLASADRKMIRYRSRRPPDLELRARLRDLANQRRRFGYRRLFVLLREQGEPSGVNRIYRLYREEGLTVRKRKARRRAVGNPHRIGSSQSFRLLGSVCSPEIIVSGSIAVLSDRRKADRS